MISPRCVDAIGDLRELIGADATDVFVTSVRHEPEHGYASIKVEVARLRSSGVRPTYQRWIAPATASGKVAAELVRLGFSAFASSGECGYNGVTVFIGGLRDGFPIWIDVPLDADADAVVGAIVSSLAIGQA